MAKIVTTSQAATGDPVEATLDKNELKLISKVSSDPIFSQESNWGLVSCIFKHKDSARRFVAAFKGSETEIMSIRPNMLAGDNFELKKIIVAKPNRELLVVNKPEIPSYADYDFTLKTSNSNTSGNYIVYNVLGGDITTNALGGVISFPNDPGYMAKALGTDYANQNYTLTFEIAPTLPYGFFCGITDSSVDGMGNSGFGIASFGASNTVCAYQFGGPASGDITLLPSGNVVRLEKIGFNRYFYVNNVLIHTLLGIHPTAEYPTVRPMSGSPVISSLIESEFSYLRDFSNLNYFGIDEVGNTGGNSPSSIENNMLLVGGNSITPLGAYFNHGTLTFKAGYTYTIRFYIESLTLVNDGISNPMLAHFDVYGASVGIGTVYEPELSNSITGVGYAERSFIGGGSTITDVTWGIVARYCNLSISKVAIIETAP